MTSTHHGRRGVAALVCLSIIFINGLVMGGPSEADASGNAASSPKDIGYYAGNLSCHRNLVALEILYGRVKIMRRVLATIAAEIPKFNATPEVIEATQKECAEAMTRVELVLNENKDNLEVKKMLDEYRSALEAMHENNQGNSAALSQIVMNLKQRFKGNEVLAEALSTPDIVSNYTKYLKEAISFIMKHKPEAFSLKSTAPEPPKKNDANNNEANGENATPEATGDVKNNVRSESEKKTSGHLIMGISAIQATAVLYLIAML